MDCLMEFARMIGAPSPCSKKVGRGREGGGASGGCQAARYDKAC